MEFADGRRQEADGRRQEAGGRRQESRRQEAGTAATGKGAMRHSQCVSPSDHGSNCEASEPIINHE